MTEIETEALALAAEEAKADDSAGSPSAAPATDEELFHQSEIAADYVEGLLDILSSDYIPSSLLMAALQLPRHVPAIDLASAVRTVTKAPAAAVAAPQPRSAAAAADMPSRFPSWLPQAMKPCPMAQSPSIRATTTRWISDVPE